MGRRSKSADEILAPYQSLADAAAGFGHNFVALDPDGPLRRVPPFVRQGDKYMPSLGVAAALAAERIRSEEVVLEDRAIRIRDRRMPLVPVPVRDVTNPNTIHQQQTMLINYRAPALVNGQRPFKSYELRHVLKSAGQIAEGVTPMIDPAQFKNKVVFVGLNAPGLGDTFQTPFGGSGKGTMPGIQMHASVADSVLSNRFIAPAPDALRVASTIACALAVGLMAAFLPYSLAAVGALIVVAGWAGLTTYALGKGSWLNMVQPVAAGALALFVGTAYRYFVEDREKRKVSRLFGRYVSKDVYARLVANPALAELGGTRRDMSVLFSDIRGFTAVTEKGNPEDLVAQLNEYFTRMVDIVFRHGGTIDKFVGDMVMALFGAPVDDVNHAEHAIAAGLEMVRELGELNRKWVEEGRAQLDIGIGINSGDMIAGNIGSSSIMSYTVIGDNVNLGARLESLNKDYQTRIIISEATRSRLSGTYDVRPLGDVVVKGKTRPVAIFEVKTPSPLQTTTEVDTNMTKVACALAVLLVATPAFAQIGGISGAVRRVDQAQKILDIKMSEEEERQLGEQVSTALCDRFGVYQDKAVAKYVAILGAVMAQASTRPNLNWQFIVLDTDGVNAYATPGGFVHITRGALGLIRNEAELAGILGHEIVHVTEKHTIKSIQASKVKGLASDEAQAGGHGLTTAVIGQLAGLAYDVVFEGTWSRDQELESDRIGIELANKIGYSPMALADVLNRIAERNTGRKEPTVCLRRTLRSRSACRRWGRRSRGAS